MNNISFKGNFFILGDTTSGVNSLNTALKSKGFVANDENGTLFLTKNDAKDRETLFKAMKQVYRDSNEDEISAAINEGFMQRAIRIDVSNLRQWPRH